MCVGVRSIVCARNERYSVGLLRWIRTRDAAIRLSANRGEATRRQDGCWTQTNGIRGHVPRWWPLLLDVPLASAAVVRFAWRLGLFLFV